MSNCEYSLYCNACPILSVGWPILSLRPLVLMNRFWLNLDYCVLSGSGFSLILQFVNSIYPMIRPLLLSDTPQILNIYRHYVEATTISFELVPPTLEEMRQRLALFLEQGSCWVCEEQGEIVGYCYSHPWKERAAYHLTQETTIYLAPQWQGRGLGRQLMLRLIESCRQRGCCALIACITANNHASCRLHEALGFKKVSHFERVGYKLGQYLDVVDYELLL